MYGLHRGGRRPDHVPRQAHILGPRQRSADRQPEHEPPVEHGVREEHLAAGVDPLEYALVERIIGTGTGTGEPEADEREVALGDDLPCGVWSSIVKVRFATDSV